MIEPACVQGCRVAQKLFDRKVKAAKGTEYAGEMPTVSLGYVNNPTMAHSKLLT